MATVWPPTPPAGQLPNALLVTDNPLMDVGITVSPKDINGAGSDATDFARTYVKRNAGDAHGPGDGEITEAVNPELRAVECQRRCADVPAIARSS